MRKGEGRPAPAARRGEIRGTEWLHNCFEVGGPAEHLNEFVMAAQGPGFIDWRWGNDDDLDYWAALLMANGAPSMHAAHKLAARIYDRLWLAFAQARTRADLNPGAVPLDLNALIPVPRKILRKGHLNGGGEWCWENWGTRYPLRHVSLSFETRRIGDSGIGSAAVYHFDSADWSPWRALLTVRERWPGLRFDLKPIYDEEDEPRRLELRAA